MEPRRLTFALATLALTLAGCAGADESTATADARRFVEVAGTPFFAVAKGVTCVVTAVGSLPAAALANAVPIFEPEDKREINSGIHRTVGQTCGGPYALGAGSPQ
jgi:hypothetical protein